MSSWKRGAVLLLAMVLAVLAGRWGLHLFTTSEFLHFSVNFPSDPGFTTMSREQIGGPWSLLPESQWEGVPRGGILVWGREGEITVDLGRQGTLKELLQPWKVLISTHWIRNVGDSPRRIRLALNLCDMPTQWVTFERDWDEATHTTTRTLDPGDTFNMDWIFDVPPERRGRRDICDTELMISDVSSEQLLTRLPIHIIDSRRGEGATP